MNKPKDADAKFSNNIRKMEVERSRYMVKSYLRTRLFKIERQLMYLIEMDQANLLSEGEMQYAWSLYESKKDYFTQAFLSKIQNKHNPFA